MAKTIDYYYYSASPFTYLGHHAILDVAAKHDADINFKPVNLFGIWEVSGAVPPAKRPLVRQRYRMLELQRARASRNLPLNLKPKHFPVDATLADNAGCALILEGLNPAHYIGLCCAAVWAEDKDISDEATLAHLLELSGFDADDVLKRAKADPAVSLREQNTQDAIESDAVGVPAYVLNGEVFWGQDRIDQLDEALSSERKPYQP